MRAFLIILCVIFFLSCMTGCTFLKYLISNYGKYSEEIVDLKHEKGILTNRANEIRKLLSEGKLKTKEALKLSIELSTVTQRIAEITGRIGDKREEERKQGVPWWYSLALLGLEATGFGGVILGALKLIPGRYLGFEERKPIS